MQISLLIMQRPAPDPEQALFFFSSILKFPGKGNLTKIFLSKHYKPVGFIHFPLQGKVT
jgi:hypothetical protein